MAGEGVIIQTLAGEFMVRDPAAYKLWSMQRELAVIEERNAQLGWHQAMMQTNLDHALSVVDSLEVQNAELRKTVQLQWSRLAPMSAAGGPAVGLGMASAAATQGAHEVVSKDDEPYPELATLLAGAAGAAVTVDPAVGGPAVMTALRSAGSNNSQDSVLSGCTKEDADRLPPWTEETTTVLVQNLPARCTREEVLAAFPADGSYDFIYLPFSTKQRRTSGYMVINFLTPELALSFKTRYEGRHLPKTHRQCKSLVFRAAPYNGLVINIKHAIDKGAMDIQNEAYLPLIFRCGVAAEAVASVCPQSLCGGSMMLDFRAVATLFQ